MKLSNDQLDKLVAYLATLVEEDEEHERGGSSDCRAGRGHPGQQPAHEGPRVGRHRRPQASRVMYVVAGLAFFLIAGLEAGVIRWQLATAGNTVVSPQVFNRLFTVHGTTMIFLVGIPIVFGFANYLVPLMIGARDLAYPG